MITFLKQLNEAWCDWLFSPRADKFFKWAIGVAMTLVFGKMGIQFFIQHLWN